MDKLLKIEKWLCFVPRFISVIVLVTFIVFSIKKVAAWEWLKFFLVASLYLTAIFFLGQFLPKDLFVIVRILIETLVAIPFNLVFLKLQIKAFQL